MMMRFGREALSGVLFTGIGIGALLLGRTYGVGTTSHMGPGYFPVLLGTTLAVLGVAIMLRGLRAQDALPDFRPALRPLTCLTAAIVGFALIIETGGLLLAVLWLVLCACGAGPRFRGWEIVLTLAVLGSIACGIFVYGLGLPPSDLLP
jgi:putative tricarboxylic transport membrane protein